MNTATAILTARLGLNSQPYRVNPRDPVHGRHNPTAWKRRRERRERLEMGRVEAVLNRDLQAQGYTTIRAVCTRECDPNTGVMSLVITHQNISNG